jgi:hypothetical protein
LFTVSSVSVVISLVIFIVFVRRLLLKNQAAEYRSVSLQKWKLFYYSIVNINLKRNG